VQRRRFGAAIRRRDARDDRVRRRLRVLDEHVEVAVAVEDAGIAELVLRLVLPRRRFVSTRSAYGNASCGYL